MLPPVQLNNGANTGQLMLSISDFQKFFKSESSRYSDCIEIIDAAKPWPPIWFSAVPLFKADQHSGSADLNMITNFSYDAGSFTFYSERAVVKTNNTPGAPRKIDFTNKKVLSAGYVTCSSGFKALDTLKATKLPLNLHCFAINAQKEKLVMLQLDTVVAIKTPDNPTAKPLKAIVDLIAIYDSTNKLIFKWNPVSVLGANAVNPLYIHAPSATVSGDKIDWSHGNSISWDLDGNILYSFRHIGVGKISRADGHIMWRLDNKNKYTDNKNDTLEFYLQHDLEPVKREGNYIRYTLYSNGDFAHPKAFGLDFKANNKDGSIKFIRKRYSTCPIPSTGAGNYEEDADGNYILNYGVTPDNADNLTHTFCEVAQSNGHILAKYSLPKNVFAYKVLRLKASAIQRPIITRKENVLSAHGNMKEWTWYQLSGNSNEIITKVGTGASFKPTQNGTYCVAGKLGVGYSVSEPFMFRQ